MNQLFTFFFLSFYTFWTSFLWFALHSNTEFNHGCLSICNASTLIGFPHCSQFLVTSSVLQTLLCQTIVNAAMSSYAFVNSRIIPFAYLCAFLSKLCESGGMLPPPPITTKHHCLLFN